MRTVVIPPLAIVLLLVFGALRSVDLWRARAEALARAETRASTLAVILSEYVAGTFAAGDAALRQLVLHGRRVGGPEASDAEWAPSLASARAGLKAIGAISVLDRTLVIRHSTRRDLIGQSRSDDPAFAGALADESDGLIVSAPFRAPSVGAYLIPMGRRITASDGTVVGAVVASYLPNDLRAFFENVRVGEAGTVWLFHTDGSVVVREPSPRTDIAQADADNLIFATAVRGREGVVQGPAVGGGPSQVSAYREVPGFPLVVAVSLDRGEILAVWMREARNFAITYAVLTALLIMGLIILGRQRALRQLAERALVEARQQEADRLRDANQRLATLLEREQAARQEAEAASALKDQFVMTVSHELRTPLTAIAGWSRMLVDGMVGEEKRESALRTIERNAQAQKHLIEDLLDVAGLMAGKIRLDMREIAVADVVDNAVEAIRPAVSKKSIRLRTDIAPDVGTLTADPNRLQQIVWNLLSNAVKFTDEGGEVTLAAERRDGAIHITVRDSGVGIAPDLLPHVFERFTQGSVSRRHGGLGLGLAIVRSLAELHGGTITASSDGEGRGATFAVRIPIARG